MKRPYAGFRWHRVLALLSLLILLGCGATARPARIGFDPTFFPLQLMGQGPHISGFLKDLFAAVASREGIRFDLIEVTTGNVVDHLDRRRCAGVVTAWVPLPSRLERYRFSEPLLETGPLLVGQPSLHPFIATGLVGKEVGMSSRRNLTLLIMLYPGATPHLYGELKAAVKGLTAGPLDALFINPLQAQFFLSELALQGFGIESRPHGGRGLRLMTLRAGQQPAWLEPFTRGLAQLKREGAYEQLLVKWGLPLSSPST